MSEEKEDDTFVHVWQGDVEVWRSGRVVLAAADPSAGRDDAVDMLNWTRGSHASAAREDTAAVSTMGAGDEQLDL
ncbi:hypothetical protein E2562_017425 [Oryza meyeriana var. granulata]|uniref:Uncharacterized protein n=1 Tax=Oryza meyeriana var. granulata TaxID=110450 RepID=A0A6G1D520_9ORYZ|nr:hypothetical protein E2562_017425 [Oryza meyeriana var. granulata]